MSNEMLQKAIDLVSSLEVKNETLQIAKYELIEYTERLHKENQELKKQLEESINSYTEENALRHKMSLELNTIKTQQKEFIEWLENLIGQNETVIEVSKYGLPKECSKLLIDFYKSILSKYKETEGYKE